MHDTVLDPSMLSEKDRARLKKHRSGLAAAGYGGRARRKATASVTVKIVAEGGETDLVLHGPVAQAVVAALAEMADGHSVQVTSVADELSTTEAAALLGVSRPYFVRLLDEKTIPYRKVGSHRRVLRTDVLAYKDTMYRNAEGALGELAEQAQALGMGY